MHQSRSTSRHMCFLTCFQYTRVSTNVDKHHDVHVLRQTVDVRSSETVDRSIEKELETLTMTTHGDARHARISLAAQWRWSRISLGPLVCPSGQSVRAGASSRATESVNATRGSCSLSLSECTHARPRRRPWTRRAWSCRTRGRGARPRLVASRASTRCRCR